LSSRIGLASGKESRGLAHPSVRSATIEKDWAAPPLGFFKGGHFNLDERRDTSYFTKGCSAVVGCIQGVISYTTP